MLAAPTARPPITRYKMNSSDPCATPEPHEPQTKRIDVTIRTKRRPNLSARAPARNAPTAHPNRMDATLNPEPRLEESNARLRASTVPLMTPLSKPKRKPPSAATADIARI